MLIEIKNWKTREVIFSYDCENNTIKKTVEEAVKKGVSLMGADLKNAFLAFANISGVNLIGADLRYADLSNADLSDANLNNADLRYASLIYANLIYVSLSNADLRRANLNCTKLNHADLSCADLSDTTLIYTDFCNANLCKADLSCANIIGADFSYANLSDAEINYHMSIPEGEFIAWKKICERTADIEVIVKLKILSDSKRSRATSDKCRCDKALVLGFETLEGEPLDIKEITNYRFNACIYKVGEIVYPDEWDDNRWNECSHGIHFFLDRQSAVDY